MENQRVSDPKDVELEAMISRSIRGMGSGIHVSVHGGHVSLSGMADDYATKRSILSTVRGYSGVHDVSNNIRVVRIAD